MLKINRINPKKIIFEDPGLSLFCDFCPDIILRIDGYIWCHIEDLLRPIWAEHD